MTKLNFLVHQLPSFPLNSESIEIEIGVLKETAVSNGHPVNLIDYITRNE